MRSFNPARLAFVVIFGCAVAHTAGARAIRTDLPPPYGSGAGNWCLVGSLYCTFVSNTSPPGNPNVSGASNVSEFAVNYLEDDTGLVSTQYPRQPGYLWESALEWNFTAYPVTATTDQSQPPLGQIVEFLSSDGFENADVEICPDSDTTGDQTCVYSYYDSLEEVQYNYAIGSGCDTGATFTYGATTYASDVSVPSSVTSCDNTFMFVDGSLLGGTPTGWSVASVATVSEPGTLYLYLAAAASYFVYALCRRRRRFGQTRC